MRLSYLPFLIIAILAFGLINFYIGHRGWHGIAKYIPGINIKLYWLLFWPLALSFVISRIFSGLLSRYISQVGAFWLCFMLYIFIFIALIDFIRLVNKRFGFISPILINQKSFSITISIIIIISVMLIIIFGTYNAGKTKFANYNVSIDKKCENIKKLNLIFISDVHAGNLNNNRIKKMVEDINNLKPDIVLFGGDVIDEGVDSTMRTFIEKEFIRIKSKYGVYGVLGNHEYYGSSIDVVLASYKKSGIIILRDEAIKVADSFYLVGRDDKTDSAFTSSKKKNISEIIKDIDKSFPVVLAVHKPNNFNEAIDNGIDLQLSGHTHAGQFFPNTIITNFIYELNWGYLKKSNLNIIVSSGFGFWGPPIRVGTNSEIVNTVLEFKK